MSLKRGIFGGFIARMIQHEMDHLFGRHLSNLSVSDGNLDIQDQDMIMNDRLQEAFDMALMEAEDEKEIEGKLK